MQTFGNLTFTSVPYKHNALSVSYLFEQGNVRHDLLINGSYSKQRVDSRNGCQTASDMFNKRERRVSSEIRNSPSDKSKKKKEITTVVTLKLSN